MAWVFLVPVPGPGRGTVGAGPGVPDVVQIRPGPWADGVLPGACCRTGTEPGP